jgi:hypothetical protein
MFNSIQQRFSAPNFKNIAFKGTEDNKHVRGSSASQPAPEDVYTGRRGSSPAPSPASGVKNPVLGSENNVYHSTVTGEVTTQPDDL